MISSIRRVRDNGRGQGRSRGRGGQSRGSLDLFSDVRFKGERRTFNGEASNLQFVDFNDRARSLQIVGSGSWEICSDADFQNCVVVTSDVPDLARMGISRRISSLRPR